MSGLKINFLKSEVFTIGGDNTVTEFYANMFGCLAGTLPIKYLGVPISFSSLKNSDWDFLDAKMLKSLDAWSGNSLFSGGRNSLLNSSLIGIPSYYMSMFLLKKTFIVPPEQNIY